MSIYKPARDGFIVLFCMGLLIAGCEKEDITNINVVQNNNSNISVTGRVLSHPNRNVIANAQYMVQAAEQSGTVDENGVFGISGLSPGDYELTVSAQDHVSASLSLDYNFLTKAYVDQHYYYDILLLEKTASLELTVYEAPDGQPLPGALVEVVDVRPPSQSLPYRVEATQPPGPTVTDSNGVLTLTELPVSTITVSVGAHDVDGDGSYDYGTSTRTIALSPNATTKSIIVMQPPTDDVELVSTSIPGSGGSLSAPTSYLLFSTPMNTEPEHTVVELWRDNYPTTEVSIKSTWVSPIKLEIEPLEALSRVNMDYNLSIIVENTSGDIYELYRRIYWITSAGGEPLGDCDDVISDLSYVLGPVDINNTTSVTLDLDYDTNMIYLQWSALACAGGYRIYAKDDWNTDSWVFIRDESTDYESGTIGALCHLPPSFDRYQVDGIQTPLAGINVDFMVIPLYASIPVPGPPHLELRIADAVLPTVFYSSQSGVGNNNTAEQTNLRFTVVCSEYLDPMAADPQIVITEAGGDPGFALNPAEGTWVWEPGMKRGYFEFILEPGTDASEDILQIVFQDLTDLSGNVAPGETSTDPISITGAGGMFDFEISGQDWVDEGQGWEWGTPTIGPSGAHSGVSCWGTSLHDSYGNGWNTSLVSPTVIVPVVSPTVRFWGWSDTESCCDYCRLYVRYLGSDYEIGEYRGSSTSWTERTASISNYAGQEVNFVFEFRTDGSVTDWGFFFDDFEVVSDSK